MNSGIKPNNLSLFSDIMPFGGKLDESNRWVKLSGLVPWERLVDLHNSYFDVKRISTVKSGRLIIGLLIGKIKMGLSDVEILNYFYENPYFQYFCGYDHFIVRSDKKVIDSSLLTRRRKKLGEKYFLEFENEILEILKEHKLIKGKELLIDATVTESKISYPSDIRLLNVVREFCIKKISWLKKTLKFDQIDIRNYKRVAKRTYLDYAKKKRKSQKLIRSTTRKMLSFTSRNIRQLEMVINQSVDRLLNPKNFKISFDFIDGLGIIREIKNIQKQLITAKEILKQQSHKYRDKTNIIANRIVSFEQPFIRPIVRGKEGKKNVEFGAKSHIASSEGYAFSNKIEHRAFSEKLLLEDSLNQHQTRFNRMPKKCLLDDAYSSIANKKLLKQHNIKHSLKNQGITNKKGQQKKKQLRKERSKIEGVIGNLKKDYSLEKITLKGENGANIQTSLAMGTFNMFKALRAIEAR